jgi:hypothetical protein
VWVQQRCNLNAALLQKALSSLEMPRFTRRYPKLADSVLRQMLTFTHEFEAQYLEALEEQKKRQQRMQQQQGRRQQEEKSSQNMDGEPSGGGDEDADPDQDGDETTEPSGQKSLQVRLASAVRVFGSCVCVLTGDQRTLLVSF